MKSSAAVEVGAVEAVAAKISGVLELPQADPLRTIGKPLQRVIAANVQMMTRARSHAVKVIRRLATSVRNPNLPRRQ